MCVPCVCPCVRVCVCLGKEGRGGSEEKKLDSAAKVSVRAALPSEGDGLLKL